MLEQIGPKKLWSQLKAEAPRYAKLIPELPRLVHLFLQHHSQHVPSPQTQALLAEQRRTNQLLGRFFWTGLGFVAGLLLMQLFFKTH